MALPDEHAQLLKQNRLLAGLTEEVIAELAGAFESKEWPAGQVVFEEGAMGDCLYLILKGAVTISKTGRRGQQERLVVLGPGEFFGEMSVIDREPRSARAETALNSVLIEVREEGLRRLLAAGEGEVGFNLVRGAVERLRGANQHFIEELRREERLSAIGAMAGSIVHDFKSPMSAISGCCELLLLRHPDEEVRELIELIQRATWAMVGMTQDVLDFTKGNLQFRVETADWQRLERPLEEQVIRPLQHDGYRVETEVNVNGLVRMDFDRMLRVLANLFKNAREASTRKNRIIFRAWQEPREVVLEVTDEGKGMSPELVARLFHVFVTEGKPDGTGLGLAVAKTVVEGQGGTISVRSELGHGTTFTIRLPQDLEPGWPAK